MPGGAGRCRACRGVPGQPLERLVSRAFPYLPHELVPELELDAYVSVGLSPLGWTRGESLRIPSVLRACGRHTHSNIDLTVASE